MQMVHSRIRWERAGTRLINNLLTKSQPKSRNMKIMRRVVRSVVLGEKAGDLSSLVNPEAVEELRLRTSDSN